METRIGLLGAALVAVTLFACARDHAAPSSSKASLLVQVSYSDETVPGFATTTGLPPQLMALVSTARVRAIELEGGDVVEKSVELTPADTTFQLQLAVPAGQDYRIEVNLLGTRETGGRSTESGLLFSGFDLVYDVSAEEPTVVRVVLENRVPFLIAEERPDAIALDWTDIPNAVAYRIRETIDGAPREFAAAGSDTVLSLPPRRGAQSGALGGEVRSYRVRAELPEQPSAFSEAWQFELQGPRPPRAVLDLSAGAITPTSIELRWTAPGDDDEIGQATEYDLRRSGAEIDEENFSFAIRIPNVPAPGPSGTEETVLVSDLDPESVYYFALRSIDEVPLASGISNLLQASTAPPPDTTPPDPTPSLLAGSATETTLEIVWTATGDDGSTGTAAGYDLRIALFPIDEANFGLANQVIVPGDPGPPGTPESVVVEGLSRDTLHHFALRILDDAENGSTLTTGSGRTADETAPATIALTAAALSETEIRLDWIAPGDDGALGQATLYDLRYSEVPLEPEEFEDAIAVEGEPAPAVAGVPQFATVPGLNRDTPYYFAIRASDNAENFSGFSNVAADTTLDLTPPSRVSDLIAVATSESSVRLDWMAPGDDGAVGRATEYELRYADFTIDELNFDQATLVPTPTPATAGTPESADVPGLEIDQPYSFALRSRDNVGNLSEISNVAFATPADMIPPAMVTDLAASDIQANQISVGWTAPGDDGSLGTATSYDLAYATFALDDDNFDDATHVMGMPPPAPAGSPEAATIQGLEPRTAYYIALRTADDAGNVSPLSNVLQADTGQPPPDAPSDLVAESVSFEEIALTWTDVATNEDSYEVERRQPPEEEFELVATLPGPFTNSVQHLDSDLAERTQYGYRVRARNTGGVSDYSNEAIGRTGMAPPFDLAAQATGPSSIALSWGFGIDPTGFRIERRTGTGPFLEVADLLGTERSWPDEGLDPLTSYAYRVRGYDSFGSSPFSNKASAMTPDLNPLCELRPLSVDFGTVEAGFVKTLPFEIENIGGGILSGTVSAACGGAWSIVAGSGFYSLSGGQVHTVSIAFSPPGVGSFACSIDAGASCGTVECIGEGLDPRGVWASGFGPAENGTDDAVRALYLFSPVTSSGRFGGDLLVAGGDFTSAGPELHSYVAGWTGSSWLEMDGGLPGPVFAFSEYFGLLHAGGSFDEPVPFLGTTPRKRLAYWVTGSFWSGTFDYPDNTIRTMVESPLSPIVIGGDFITGGSQVLNHVADFQDGSLQSIGSLDDPGVTGIVRASTVFGGHTVIGGDFTFAESTQVNRIVSWTGSTWLPLGSGLNGPVHALASDGSFLYAGGNFTIAGGVTARGIAVWDGQSWAALDPSLDFRPVHALLAFDGEIIAGGSWEIGAPELPLNRIAAWNGQQWHPLGHGIGDGDGDVLALGALNGSIFAGGVFSVAGGVPSSNIARWDPAIGTVAGR